MTGFETIGAITNNIEEALRGLGFKFTRKAIEGEESIPAGLLPLARIYYLGERFEDGFGERPLYVDAGFLVRVSFASKEITQLVMEQQRAAHQIREALTIDALNSGALSETKNVSRVAIEECAVRNRGGIPELEMKVAVRYREA
ncbi:MAG TPA: hypothetical protein VII64_02545 [Thermodesulfobacteriota bacterium]